jgi:uroporphyrinogen decarboxylase
VVNQPLKIMIMTPKNRVLEAINLNEPDRVPIHVTFTPQIAKKLREKFKINENIKDVALGTVFGDDLVIAVPQYDITSEYARQWNNLNKGDVFEDHFGIIWKKTEYYIEPVRGPLENASLKDLENYQFPNPLNESMYKEVKEIIDKYSDNYAIMGFAPQTMFELSWHLRGFENFLKDMVLNRDFAELLLDKAMTYKLSIAKKLVGMGVDIIHLGDDFGGQNRMLISPDLWRQVIKPRFAKVCEELKRLNPDIKIDYHSDGYIEPIIPDLIEIGIDVLNPVQPKSMDPADLKKKFGHRIAFRGTIDIQETLISKDPQDVINEVKERIKTVGKGGGLIIGPTHNVQPDTPLENIMAFYEAVKKFGKY